MIIKTYKTLIADALKTVKEISPWDLEYKINNKNKLILLDIREPKEYRKMRIKDSINIPRGVLEQALEWGYDETEPHLIEAKNKEIIVICRSGNRSVLAAYTMCQLGYKNVKSLKLGIKGWNDSDFPLINNKNNTIDNDDADLVLSKPVTKNKLKPSLTYNLRPW